MRPGDKINVSNCRFELQWQGCGVWRPRGWETSSVPALPPVHVYRSVYLLHARHPGGRHGEDGCVASCMHKVCLCLACYQSLGWTRPHAPHAACMPRKRHACPTCPTVLHDQRGPSACSSGSAPGLASVARDDRDMCAAAAGASVSKLPQSQQATGGFGFCFRCTIYVHAGLLMRACRQATLPGCCMQEQHIVYPFGLTAKESEELPTSIHVNADLTHITPTVREWNMRYFELAACHVA